MNCPALRACALVSVASLVILVAPIEVHAAFTEQGATLIGGANYSGRSASLADIDNDGDLDLLFQGGNNGNQQLFRNNLINAGGSASFTFTNVTATMFPAPAFGPTWSAAWGDYNNDGNVDVFIGQSTGTGTLLKNNGAAGFSNVNASTGLNTPAFSNGFSQNVGWGDFNNDHRLDLVIGMEGPEKNQLYVQQANGTFSEVGATVGLQAPLGYKSYGLAVGDYDSDGDMDIYISTCASGNIRNNFFKNMLKESGTNTLSFVDVADINGTQNMNNTYGTQFVDLDNDGDLDLFVTGADGNNSKIYRNNGDGNFTDIDTITGHVLLSNVGTDLNGFRAVDYDNDGKLDLYFHDNLSGSGNIKLYHNDGNWQFSNATTAVGLAGGGNTGAGGYDGTWGDLDRDGDQDLINPNNSTFGGSPSPERVYINDASANGNHWLYVELNGPSWNTTGIGTSLYATTDAGSANQLTLRRESNTDAGTFNQSDLPVHFGLAAADHVDWLRVVWADGKVQYLHSVAANQYITVSYANALPGDFSGDGVVDTSDYIIWRDNFNAPFTMDDYNTWRGNFGSTLAGLGTGAGVPEPTTFALFLVAGLAAIPCRNRGPGA